MIGIKIKVREGDINRDGYTYCAGKWWPPIVPNPKNPDSRYPDPLWRIHKNIYWALTQQETMGDKKAVVPAGHKGRKYHFMQAVNLIWGTPDSRYRFEWNPFSELMLENKLKYSYLMVAGHGSSGKSFFAAIWAVLNFLCDPENTKVLVTSMTRTAAEGKIWGDVHEAWQQAGRSIAASYGCTDTSKSEDYLPAKYLQIGMIKFEDNDGFQTKKAGLELIPCDASSAKDSAEKVQGYKRDRIFVVLDELASLNHQIMTTIESNIFTNPRADVIGLFNPDSHSDPAGRASEPVGGWHTVTINDQGWRNKHGWTMRLDGALSPNVVLGYERYRGMLTREKFEEAKSTKSEKEFNKQYRAWWSGTGTRETIFTDVEIEQYLAHLPLDPKSRISPPIPVAMLDPSFKHGGDKAVLRIGLCGDALVNGKKKAVLSLRDEDMIHLDASMDVKKDKNEQVVALAIAECKKRNIQPQHFALDVTGGGGPLYTLFARDWSDKIMQIEFGSSPSDKPISRADKTPAKEKYYRLPDEMWFTLKSLVRWQHIRGLHPEEIRQMTARLFSVKNGKIQIESKDEMKKRALKSPNEADALAGLAHLCRMRLGLLAEEEIAGKPSMSRSGESYRKLAQSLSGMTNGGFKYSGGNALWSR